MALKFFQIGKSNRKICPPWDFIYQSHDSSLISNWPKQIGDKTKDHIWDKGESKDENDVVTVTTQRAVKDIDFTSDERIREYIFLFCNKIHDT